MAKKQEFKYVFIIVFILIILCTAMNIKGKDVEDQTIDVVVQTNTKEYQMTPKKVIENPSYRWAGAVVQQQPVRDKKMVFGSEETKFCNLLINQFDFTDLKMLANAYIIVDPSDLLERPPLFGLPNFVRKSISTVEDINEVSTRVADLQSRKNNVGAYMTIGSLEAVREDVYLQNLEYDKDYSLKYKRAMVSGDEYLPLGNVKTGRGPTEVYEDFMRYRLSQIKRSGFDFVYFGQLDPTSYFDATDDSNSGGTIFTNPSINLDAYRQFITRIFKYAMELNLKICISDFPSIFDGYEKQMARYVNFINVFSIDSRSFPKPSPAFIRAFSALPVFLSTIYNNDVIKNFLNSTGWPYYSILYEMTPINNPFPIDLDLVVVNQLNLNWYQPPPRTWVNGMLLSIPNLSNQLLVDTAGPVYPVRNVYQPSSLPQKPLLCAS